MVMNTSACLLFVFSINQTGDFKIAVKLDSSCSSVFSFFSLVFTNLSLKLVKV